MTVESDPNQSFSVYAHMALSTSEVSEAVARFLDSHPVAMAAHRYQQTGELPPVDIMQKIYDAGVRSGEIVPESTPPGPQDEGE